MTQKKSFLTFISAHKFITICAVVTSLFVLAGFISYLTPQRLIDFKVFAPVNGVRNVTLTVTTPEVYALPLDFLPSKPTVSFDLSSRGGVSESKNTNFEYVCPKPGTVIGEMCQVGVSPRGQKFIQTLSYNPSDLKASPLVYDKLTSQHASFERDGTMIGISLNLVDVDNAPTSVDQWGEFIDSFEPTDFSNMTVVRVHPGP